MDLAHCSSNKRFDILKHIPLPYHPYVQHKYTHSNEHSSYKLAPISFKRGYVREKLPSIDQLHILNTESHGTDHCPSSPQSFSSCLESSYSSSSSPTLSSALECHSYKAPSSDHFISPHTTYFGDKIRLNVSKRTYISEDQTAALLEFYETSRYPTHKEKVKLSKKLNLTERTIQVWFQNRRQNRGLKCKLN